jgi:hypothetical protein
MINYRPITPERIKSYLSFSATIKRCRIPKKSVAALSQKEIVLLLTAQIYRLEALVNSTEAHATVNKVRISKYLRRIQNYVVSSLQGYQIGMVDKQTVCHNIEASNRELKTVSVMISAKYGLMISHLPITEVEKVSPVNHESATFNNLDQLGSLLDALKVQEEQITKIKQKLQSAENNDEDDGEDDSARPKPPQIDQKAVVLEALFAEMAKQIKLPQLDQENPWKVIRLPLYLITYPTLPPVTLKRFGIVDHKLTIGEILENQLCLAMYSRYKPEKGESSGKGKDAFEIMQDSSLFKRASNMISSNFTDTFYYSVPFSYKMLTITWMIPMNLYKSLGTFKIKTIGLPLAPDLRKAVDLTNDARTIKKDLADESKSRDDLAKKRLEVLKPLISERDELADKVRELSVQIRDLNAEITKNKSEGAMYLKIMDQTKKEETNRRMELKLKAEVCASRVQRLTNQLNALRTVTRPALQEEITRLSKNIHDFYLTIK